MSVTNKPQQWGPNHEQDDYHTLPGEYARRLQNQYGLERRVNEAAWYVDPNAETVERVHIDKLYDAHGRVAGQPDYALLSDNRRVPAMYLFPVRKHLQPIKKRVKDEHGTCEQWVAPWRKGVYKPWT